MELDDVPHHLSLALFQSFHTDDDRLNESVKKGMFHGRTGLGLWKKSKISEFEDEVELSYMLSGSGESSGG